MSIITNKETKIQISETEKANYGTLIIECLNQVPQGGFTVSEMQKRLNIVNYILSVKTNDPLDFKAEDAVLVKQVVETKKWNAMHEDIVNLWNDISQL